MYSLGSGIGFEAIFKYATVGIVVVDDRGTIALANPNAEKLFGYKAHELSGLKLENLLPDNLRETHKAHRNGYFANPHSREMGLGMDLKAQKKNGKVFPVEISLSYFEIEGRNMAVAFVSDITERKNIEGKLKQLNEELEGRVKARTTELTDALIREKEIGELKSRFVSIASHEFRTPLSVILSSISLIERYTETDQQDKRDKHVHRIKNSVRNLTDILNDFLSLEKLQQGKMIKKESAFDLPALIHEIVDEARTTAQSGQTISYAHSGDESIWLDQKILRNIFLNLLSNAIKYSRPNDPIEVVTWLEEGKLHIEITDHGIGIPEVDQKHLFTKFFRAQNTEGIQGTGLGLNIVKHYVELLGGTIQFTSEAGVGTTFSVEI